MSGRARIGQEMIVQLCGNELGHVVRIKKRQDRAGMVMEKYERCRSPKEIAETTQKR